MLIKNKNHFKFAPHVRYLEPSHDVFAGGGGEGRVFWGSHGFFPLLHLYSLYSSKNSNFHTGKVT